MRKKMNSLSEKEKKTVFPSVLHFRKILREFFIFNGITLIHYTAILIAILILCVLLKLHFTNAIFYFLHFLYFNFLHKFLNKHYFNKILFNYIKKLLLAWIYVNGKGKVTLCRWHKVKYTHTMLCYRLTSIVTLYLFFFFLRVDFSRGFIIREEYLFGL